MDIGPYLNIYLYHIDQQNIFKTKSLELKHGESKTIDKYGSVQKLLPYKDNIILKIVYAVSHKTETKFSIVNYRISYSIIVCTVRNIYLAHVFQRENKNMITMLTSSRITLDKRLERNLLSIVNFRLID